MSRQINLVGLLVVTLQIYSALGTEMPTTESTTQEQNTITHVFDSSTVTTIAPPTTSGNMTLVQNGTTTTDDQEVVTNRYNFVSDSPTTGEPSSTKSSSTTKKPNASGTSLQAVALVTILSCSLALII